MLFDEDEELDDADADALPAPADQAECVLPCERLHWNSCTLTSSFPAALTLTWPRLAHGMKTAGAAWPAFSVVGMALAVCYVCVCVLTYGYEERSPL